MPIATISTPRIGAMALVRNRRGIITGVTPYQAKNSSAIHLVDIEYGDSDGASYSDRLLWELEPSAELVAPSHLPSPSVSVKPMVPREFDALLRAVRWGAFQPFVSPDHSATDEATACLSSPFHAAIQTEDYQLVPLLKAMASPRISLLIADDVGLGKTIEAGLILSELIQRRRIRRILILCPAPLRHQWREELQSKFSLGFDVVDRAQTLDLRKRLGQDANPWRQIPRIITSYHYLKQPDVLEEFRASSQPHKDSPNLAWDLLIVDEAHNLAPPPIGKESELSLLLGHLAPYFEHKIFLTATPHNGHPRSFTGLLERLDPVRFTRTADMSEAERKRIPEVNIRRLKSEINARSNPPRFCTRHLEELQVAFSREEQALSLAFDHFRTGVRRHCAPSGERRMSAGRFAVEMLGKRLLSCPYAFADSWSRIRAGLESLDKASYLPMSAAERSVREEIDDDLEAESRQALAASAIGSWLHPYAGVLATEIQEVQSALDDLRLSDFSSSPTPLKDARLESLLSWVDKHLRTSAGTWQPDERLIVFTEYKTTLDYLLRRLLQRYKDAPAILSLYGDLNQTGRDVVTSAFNNPQHPVRILVATDAASEGLNLQETARYVLHFDIPWNPSRLEQRNGRLDRHGQARDVFAHHFTSNDNQDLAFLARIVSKVHQIRTDLGATGEVFVRGLERRFVEGVTDQGLVAEIENEADRRQKLADMPRDDTTGVSTQDLGKGADLVALAAELDYTPDTLRSTLETALGLGWDSWPIFTRDDSRPSPRFHFRGEVPRAWNTVVDESIRLPQTQALPYLAFDPTYYLDRLPDGRSVFRPKPETKLLHLGHPLFRQTFASFARERFRDNGKHRWIVRHGAVPPKADAVIILHVEEMAVNNLRETFHHWVRTFAWTVTLGNLGPLLPHRSPSFWSLECSEVKPSETTLSQAVSQWEHVEEDVRNFLTAWKSTLTDRLLSSLSKAKEKSAKDESERFNSRQGELSNLIESRMAASLQAEWDKLSEQLAQGNLFIELDFDILQKQSAIEEELRYRNQHLETLRAHLSSERERIIHRLIPARHTLSGDVQVLPVALEIRLPERT